MTLRPTVTHGSSKDTLRRSPEALRRSAPLLSQPKSLLRREARLPRDFASVRLALMPPLAERQRRPRGPQLEAVRRRMRYGLRSQDLHPLAKRLEEESMLLRKKQHQRLERHRGRAWCSSRSASMWPGTLSAKRAFASSTASLNVTPPPSLNQILSKPIDVGAPRTCSGRPPPGLGKTCAS